MKQVLLALTLASSAALLANPALSNEGEDPSHERESLENQDSSTSVSPRGYGHYPKYCEYYDYSHHYDGASYPYILGNPYNDDYKRYPDYWIPPC